MMLLSLSFLFAIIDTTFLRVTHGAEAYIHQDNSQILKAITGNYTLWKSQCVTDYEFTFTWSCFCDQCYTAEKLIQVTNSSTIKNVSYTSNTTAKSCNGFGLPSDYQTINQLFETLINYAINNNSYYMNVQFNTEYGYPVVAGIDRCQTCVDDWTGWDINSIAIHSQSQSCVKYY